MQVNNTTSVDFTNTTTKQKWSKATEMSFYWIRDCTRQVQLNIYWSTESNNLGDYHTKHHAPGHHRLMCSKFLHIDPHVNLKNLVIMHILRWCVNTHRLHAVRA